MRPPPLAAYSALSARAIKVPGSPSGVGIMVATPSDSVTMPEAAMRARSSSMNRDWAGAGGDPLLPSPGDYNYMRCMQTNCENQNVDFRRVCSREPVQNQEMCYRYTAKYYFKCERECWYASY